MVGWTEGSRDRGFELCIYADESWRVHGSRGGGGGWMCVCVRVFLCAAKKLILYILTSNNELGAKAWVGGEDLRFLECLVIVRDASGSWAVTCGGWECASDLWVPPVGCSRLNDGGGDR